MGYGHFMVRLKGCFYSFELYCRAKGDHFRSLEAAIEEAEAAYGEDWTEVYNGNGGASREETLVKGGVS